MLEPSFHVFPFRLFSSILGFFFQSEVTVPAPFGWRIRKKPHMNAWCWSDPRSRRRSSQFMSTSICPDSGILFFRKWGSVSTQHRIWYHFMFENSGTLYTWYIYIYFSDSLFSNEIIIWLYLRIDSLLSICNGILSEQLFHCTCNLLWHQPKSKFLDCLFFRAYWV